MLHGGLLPLSHVLCYAFQSKKRGNLKLGPLFQIYLKILVIATPNPYKEHYLGIEVPNMVLDFWVVAMPVFKIHQLQLLLRYKISISIIFVLAGLYVFLTGS